LERIKKNDSDLLRWESDSERSQGRRSKLTAEEAIPPTTGLLERNLEYAFSKLAMLVGSLRRILDLSNEPSGQITEKRKILGDEEKEGVVNVIIEWLIKGFSRLNG